MIGKLPFVLVVRKFFMLLDKKETAFNYCAQWSGQEIDCSII